MHPGDSHLYPSPGTHLSPTAPPAESVAPAGQPRFPRKFTPLLVVGPGAETFSDFDMPLMDIQPLSGFYDDATLLGGGCPHHTYFKFSCEYCRIFKGHVSRTRTSAPVEDKRFPCNICGKEFRRKDNMLTHMRIHTGEKPFPCPVCGHTFRHRSSLTIHLRLHSESTGFGCSLCKFVCRSKYSLAKHLSEMHSKM
jgi:hypothetical protein